METAMSDRVEVEDVQWTPGLPQDQSRRLLLLLFGPSQDGLAKESARHSQPMDGSHVLSADDGRGEVEA
jgi:hypothetical protein